MVAAALRPPFWRRGLGLGDARGFPTQGGLQREDLPWVLSPWALVGDLPVCGSCWTVQAENCVTERRGGGWPWGNCSQADIGHRLTRLRLTAAADFSGIQKPALASPLQELGDGPPPSSTSAQRRRERGETPCSAGFAEPSGWMLHQPAVTAACPAAPASQPLRQVPFNHETNPVVGPGPGMGQRGRADLRSGRQKAQLKEDGCTGAAPGCKK